MITVEQREQRRHHLGSSDVAALFGLDQFNTLSAVYWEKVGPFLPDRSDDPSLQLGHLLEDAICGYAAIRLGAELERNLFIVSGGRDDGLFAANLDGRVRDRRQGIEAKYAGDDTGWGEEGTDHVPDRVVLQCQEQCYVADLDLVWVPALIIGYRAQFRLYCIHRNEELIEAIVERGTDFWRRHVEPRIPPDDLPPPVEALKALRRAPKSVAALGDNAIVAWHQHEAAKRALREAEKAADVRKAAVLWLLGEAEGGRLPDERLITFLEENGQRQCDFTLLRAQWPEAYARCVRQGTRRVLRIKEPNSKGA